MGARKSSELRDDYFSTRIAGDVGTEDARRRAHTIQLTLKLCDGNVLNGGASAISIPNERGGNALTHWAEVRKQ